MSKIQSFNNVTDFSSAFHDVVQNHKHKGPRFVNLTKSGELILDTSRHAWGLTNGYAVRAFTNLDKLAEECRGDGDALNKIYDMVKDVYVQSKEKAERTAWDKVCSFFHIGVSKRAVDMKFEKVEAHLSQLIKERPVEVEKPPSVAEPRAGNEPSSQKAPIVPPSVLPPLLQQRNQ